MRRFPDPLWLAFRAITAAYLLFLVALLGATATHSSPADLCRVFGSREIRYAIGLSLVTCTATSILALLLAVPVGYLLSRGRFAGGITVPSALNTSLTAPKAIAAKVSVTLRAVTSSRVASSASRWRRI